MKSDGPSTSVGKRRRSEEEMGCLSLTERDEELLILRDSTVQWKGLQSGAPGCLGSHPCSNPVQLDCTGFHIVSLGAKTREADTDSPSESPGKAIDEKCRGKVEQY